jgi:hypothetical protein
MIARAIAADIPFAWVLGDAVYGSDRRLRIDLEQQQRPFVLAIRSNEKLWSRLDGQTGQHAAAALAAAIPEAAWQRLLSLSKGGGRWRQRRAGLRLGAGAPDAPATAALGPLAARPSPSAQA